MIETLRNIKNLGALIISYHTIVKKY